MRAFDLMSSFPACCEPRQSLAEVARLMVDHDCGDIPVVDTHDSARPIGMITDRDIVCRAVARGLNPLTLRAEDCMTTPVFTVSPDTSILECCRLMEERQIRRLPIVDQDGRCCGVISQADIAREAGRKAAGTLVREVSRPKGIVNA